MSTESRIEHRVGLLVLAAFSAKNPARVPHRYLQRVNFGRIEDHLRMGWLILKPLVFLHHDVYGVDMGLMCDCKLPGGKHELRSRN